ncbi:hypothetical protein HOD08_05415 [bacterium]|jgi:hypothetical protein|nr:hypothetical protein [bacterium]
MRKILSIVLLVAASSANSSVAWKRPAWVSGAWWYKNVLSVLSSTGSKEKARERNLSMLNLRPRGQADSAGPAIGIIGMKMNGRRCVSVPDEIVFKKLPGTDDILEDAIRSSLSNEHMRNAFNALEAENAIGARRELGLVGRDAMEDSIDNLAKTIFEETNAFGWLEESAWNEMFSSKYSDLGNLVFVKIAEYIIYSMQCAQAELCYRFLVRLEEPTIFAASMRYFILRNVFFYIALACASDQKIFKNLRAIFDKPLFPEARSAFLTGIAAVILWNSEFIASKTNPTTLAAVDCAMFIGEVKAMFDMDDFYGWYQRATKGQEPPISDRFLETSVF